MYHTASKILKRSKPCSSSKKNERKCWSKSSKRTKPNEKNFLKIFCRIRPLIISPTRIEEDPSFTFNNDRSSIRIREENFLREYKFSSVFNESSTQVEVFDDILVPILKETLSKNKDGLFFTYGTSGTGKTYSLIGTAKNPGILPRSVEFLMDLREKVKKFRDAGIDFESEKKYLVNDRYSLQFENPSECLMDELEIYLECFEVYNDKVYDLTKEVGKNMERRNLKVRTINKKTEILELKAQKITDIDDFYTILDSCQRNRRSGETLTNRNSSRSHAFYNLIINKRNDKFMKCSSRKIASLSKTLKICLVDLAGSERQKKTKNKGGRFKEGCKINNSLLALRRCLESLKTGSKTKIPFMESTLTRILMNLMNDQNSVSMLTTITKQQKDKFETIKVLNFATRSSTFQLPKGRKRPRKIVKFEVETEKIMSESRAKLVDINDKIKMKQIKHEVDMIAYKMKFGAELEVKFFQWREGLKKKLVKDRLNDLDQDKENLIQRNGLEGFMEQRSLAENFIFE